MNIRELVRLLAADAEALGLEATTERQVRGWNEESLLLPSRRVSGHPGRRPVWEMPAENLERGRRILVFRSQGATRSSGLMVRLWLEGFECPLFVLREALSKEMDRLSNRLFPDGNPVWIRHGELSGGPKQAAMRERQLGPLDPRLEAFRVSENDYASLAIISCDPPRDLRGAKVIAEIAERFPMIANLLQPALDGAWAGLLAKPLDKQMSADN